MSTFLLKGYKKCRQYVVYKNEERRECVDNILSTLEGKRVWFVDNKVSTFYQNNIIGVDNMLSTFLMLSEESVDNMLSTNKEKQKGMVGGCRQYTVYKVQCRTMEV